MSIFIKEFGFVSSPSPVININLNGILFTSKVVGNTKTEKELDKLFDSYKKLG